MPLYRMVCRKDHITERIFALGTESAECACGLMARRVPTFATAIVLNLAPVPSGQERHDLSLFREATEERTDAYRRAEEHFERPIQSPNLWKEAKKRANLVRRGLAPPPSSTR